MLETMVGFGYLEYTEEIIMEGFHFHFISDNRKTSRTYDRISNLRIGIDYCDGSEIKLPKIDADFNLTQEYNNTK